MGWITRAGAGAAVAAAAALVVVCAPDRPPAGRGGDEPDGGGELADAVREARDLDARLPAAIGRWTGKRAAAAALVRGDLTLDQAAERFRAVNAASPEAAGYLRALHPTATAEEATCWQVLRYTQTVVDPPDGAMTSPPLARLLAEYRRRFPAGPDPTFPLRPVG
jgi:hypothetical protein